VRTYLDLKVSGVEVIQPFQEDLVQNCNLFGEKKNERGKKMQEEMQEPRHKKQDFIVQCTKYKVPSTFRSAI
jgi:hypothetical protein